jgi:hypothetical protein
MALFLILAALSMTPAFASDGDSGYICPGRSADVPAIKADDDARRCGRDEDCLVLAGPCNRCWLTVSRVYRGGLAHLIQREENLHGCFRPNLPVAKAQCAEGACRLRLEQ